MPVNMQYKKSIIQISCSSTYTYKCTYHKRNSTHMIWQHMCAQQHKLRVYMYTHGRTFWFFNCVTKGIIDFISYFLIRCMALTSHHLNVM